MKARRGFALLVVLVVVAAAVLAVTGTIFLVRGEVAGTANAGESVRSRAVAWSGVQAVAASLGQARAEILAGADPTVETTFTVWEAGGERGTVRLLPLGPAARTLVPENAKADLARLDADALVRSGVFDPEAAARVIAARDACGSRPLDLGSLLEHGARPDDLHGELDEAFLAEFGDATSDDEELATAARDAALAIARDTAPEPRGLCDLATVFSFDPPVGADGTPRILLSGELGDEAREALDERLGEGAASALARIAADVTDEPALLEAWASLRPDPRAWAALLDAVTLLDDGLEEGRIDLLRADESALRMLPGLPEEAAARIVRERDAFPAERRTDPSWIVERGIVDAATFRTVLPRLATRSLFWRVRIEGRIERLGDDRESEGSGTSSSRTILEAVIDLTGERPRLASLRDVTALPDAIRVLAELPEPVRPVGMPEGIEPPVTPENDLDSVVTEPELPVLDGNPAAEPETDAPSTRRSGAHGIGRWKRAG